MLTQIPSVLRRLIFGHCEIQDLLSLSASCKELHGELNLSVSSVPFEILSVHSFMGGAPEASSGEYPIREGPQIPVISTQHFRALHVSFRWSKHGRSEVPGKVYLVCCPKSQGIEATSLQSNDARILVSCKGESASVLEEFSTLSSSVSHQKNAEGSSYSCDGSNGDSYDDSNGDSYDDSNESDASPGEIKTGVTIHVNADMDYFLWCQPGAICDGLTIEDLNINRAAILGDEDGRYKHSYEACLQYHQQLVKLEETENPAWGNYTNPKDHQAASFWILARLFSLAIESVTLNILCGVDHGNAKSSIVELIESEQGYGGIGMAIDADVVHVLGDIAEVYLQLIQDGAKDRNWCQRCPNGRDSSHETNALITLPSFPLLDYQHKMHPGQNFSLLSQRIPILPGTETFLISGKVYIKVDVGLLEGVPAAPPVSLFVEKVTCSQCKSDTDFSPAGNPDQEIPLPIEGLFICESDFESKYQRILVFKVEHCIQVEEAATEYYLCAAASREDGWLGWVEQIYEIQAQLNLRRSFCSKLSKDDISSIWKSMISLLGMGSQDQSGACCEDEFHLRLLRAVVQEILHEFSRQGKPGMNRYERIIAFLEDAGFALADDPSSLSFTIDVLESLLKSQGAPIGPREENERGPLLFRTHAAM